MDKHYNKYFYTDFYNDTAGVSYENREVWSAFFGGIAQKIVDMFNPKTVLDCGCAYGYLVGALRELGVEAYGFDISEFAVDSADENTRPYLRVHSISEPIPEDIPQKYDLVITIEVLEHITPEEGKKAIKLLCGYSDTIIFTSTPSDIEDRLHINVQQPEYWAKEFAGNSFFRDLIQPVDFICPQAMLFRKESSFPEVIFNYELNKRIDKILFDKKLNKPKVYNGKVYFDLGNGFSESESVGFEYNEKGTVTQKISVPFGCVGMRADPIENFPCIVSGIVIAGNNGVIGIKQSNAVRKINETYYFTSSDPQFVLELGGGPPSWIELSFNITAIDNIRNLKYVSDFNGEFEAIRIQNSELSEKNLDLMEQLNNTKLSIDECQESFQREKNSIVSGYKKALYESDKKYAALREETTNERLKLISEYDEKIELIEYRLKTELAVELSDKKASYDYAMLLNKEKLENEKASFRNKLQDVCCQLEELSRENEKTKTELSDCKLKYNSVVKEKEYFKSAYNIICESQFWKLTFPLRKITDGLKWIFWKNSAAVLIRKGFSSLKKNGVKETWRKVNKKLRPDESLKSIAESFDISDEQRRDEEEREFDRAIKFSILVPLYNTPLNFLDEMVASVKAQTYSNWELCLTDSSDKEHKEVGREAKKLANADKRILYKKLEKNMGISANTNACIEMASGDYIALLDHDDVLHPSALFEAMKAICEKGADFIYTDEATFLSPDIKHIVTAHYKPDFAVDNLLSNNYICHLSVFSKEVLMKTGGFRSEYDGSQDHDMIIRLTLNAEKIVHIPKILYFWRSHPFSTAQDINTKTYAIEAGRKAVHNGMVLYGYEGTVESSEAFPAIYRIKYNIARKEPVSVIIVNKNNCKDLKRCMDSVLELTSYNNYKIIIADNNSDDDKILSYYESLKTNDKVKIVYMESEVCYAEIINFAVKNAESKYCVLLENNVEIITPNWIEEMMMYAQREDVGAVGAKLYYPDDTIQHAGIIIGMFGNIGYAFRNQNKSAIGYMGRLCYAQNVSAVTSSCIMFKKHDFEKVDGFDKSFAECAGVDFCLKIRAENLLIVWTPYAEAYHYTKCESSLSGLERLEKKWRDVFSRGDPYYNPHFALDREDFFIKA